jgi:hypothetical protein
VEQRHAQETLRSALGDDAQRRLDGPESCRRWRRSLA